MKWFSRFVKERIEKDYISFASFTFLLYWGIVLICLIIWVSVVVLSRQ